MSVPSNNWSSFFIFATVDVKTLVLLFSEMAEVFTLIGEELPPL
jgi:hypothetical protein